MQDLPLTATWLTASQVTAVDDVRRAARRLPEGLPVLGTALRRQLGRMFGAPDLGWGPGGSGSGLTAPDAPVRRLLAEPASIAGGVRSLMVQAAHPLALAGVAEHSRYREAPLQRLAGTSAWVTVSAFGTVDAAYAQARRVRALHRRVRGTWQGQPYSADDPRLLVWVSVALTSSLIAADRLFAPRPLGSADLDRVVASQALAAALLDPRVALDDLRPSDLPDLDVATLPLVADGLPTDVGGLAATLASYRDDLHVSAEARDAVLFLYDVEVPPLVRPAYRWFLDGVAATLPATLREALGLGHVDAAAALPRLARLVAGMRATVGRAPAYHRAVRAAGSVAPR